MTRFVASFVALVVLTQSPAWAGNGIRPRGGGEIVTTGPNGQFEFTGVITPFGPLAGDGVVTLSPTNPFQFTAVAVLEGPDGSELFVTTAGTFFPDFSGYNETITIQGGTGRFARASGTIRVVGAFGADGSQTDTVTGGCVRLR